MEFEDIFIVYKYSDDRKWNILKFQDLYLLIYSFIFENEEV